MTRVIAGDVGGTKTLIRCVDTSGEIVAARRFESARFPTFGDMLREFQTDCPDLAPSACFAVAGPVIGRHAGITNLGWTMDAAEIERTFGIGRVTLINDFYGVALGVPMLGPHDLLSLQRGARERGAPIAILGAGTGLGSANVVFHGDQWHVVPSEGGHADFAPQDEEQTRIFLFLQKRYGHVSWERLASGMGLTNIFEFLTQRVEEPAAIASLASAGDPIADRAFRIFVDIYGAEAGNMALRVIARGGVFLAGGVAAKNRAYFTDGAFIASFLRKGRFAGLLRDVPVDMIVNEEVGLLGAVEAARRWNRPLA